MTQIQSSFFQDIKYYLRAPEGKTEEQNHLTDKQTKILVNTGDVPESESVIWGSTNITM